MDNDIIISRCNCETPLSTIASQLTDPKTFSKTLSDIMENLLKNHSKNKQTDSMSSKLYEELNQYQQYFIYEKQNIISTEYYFKGEYIVNLRQPFTKQYSLILNVHYQSDFHAIIFAQLSNINNSSKEVKGCLQQKNSIIIETASNNIINLLRNISKFRQASSIFCDILKGKYDNLEEGDVFIIGYERKEKTKLFALKVISINNKRNNHFEIAFEVTGIKENGDKIENLKDIPKQNISLIVSWINCSGPVVVNFIHHFPEGVIVDYFKNLSIGKNMILKQLKNFLEKSK